MDKYIDKAIKEIKKALYDEHNEHETCGFHFGCIVESDPLEKQLKQTLEKVRLEERERIIKKITFSQGYKPGMSLRSPIMVQFGEGNFIRKDRLIKSLSNKQKDNNE